MCDNLPPFEEDRRALRPDLGLYLEASGASTAPSYLVA